MYMRLFVFFSRLWYWKNNMKLCGGYGCQCVFWRLVGKINVWWGGNDGLCHRVWLISILLSVQWWYLTSMSHIIFTHNFYLFVSYFIPSFFFVTKNNWFHQCLLNILIILVCGGKPKIQHFQWVFTLYIMFDNRKFMKSSSMAIGDL